MDALIQALAREGGDRAWQAFGSVGVDHCKQDNPNNVVTATDVAVEEYIIAGIKAAYPSHGILAEESGAHDVDAEYVWVIDPIDGTLNFATGIPLFATMIAQMRAGDIERAAIYLPNTKELYYAKKGEGAWCNTRRLMPCVGGGGMGRTRGCLSSPASKRCLALVRRINDALPGAPVHINSFGSMGVHACYVAAGKRDWMVSFASSFHDLAATALILQEAGCTVTDSVGGPIRRGSVGIVATRPECHKMLLEAVEEGIRPKTAL